MIIDSSAIVAVFFREPGFEKLLDQLASAAAAGIGTPTLVETGIVLTARMGKDARTLVSRFVEEFEIQTIPFGEHHWREAVSAYARFGRGRHPAALNFGDCMTYSVARLSDQPLLFVGDDFTETDLRPALS